MENLIDYQVHKHSHKGNKKLKSGQICRFGFPKPPMEETRILLPLSQNVNEAERREAQDLYVRIQGELNEMGRSFNDDIEYDDFLENLGNLTLNSMLFYKLT
jgi:hypothetical protein